MFKSEHVILTLLTGTVLFNILHHGPVYRDRYTSREACEADWKANPSYCEPVSGGSSGGGASGLRSATGGDYYGPSYERGARPVSANRLASTRTETVTRSGFGRSGARFSGGG